MLMKPVQLIGAETNDSHMIMYNSLSITYNKLAREFQKHLSDKKMNMA